NQSALLGAPAEEFLLLGRQLPVIVFSYFDFRFSIFDFPIPTLRRLPCLLSVPHPCVLALSPTAAAAALCVSPAIRCSVLFTRAARTAPILPKPSDASSLTSSPANISLPAISTRLLLNSSPPPSAATFRPRPRAPWPTSLRSWSSASTLQETNTAAPLAATAGATPSALPSTPTPALLLPNSPQ